MPIDSIGTARNVLHDLATHCIPPTDDVQAALANADRLAKQRPDKDVRTLEREAGRALANGDDARVDKLLREAALRPGRGQAYGHALALADNAIIAAVRAAAPELAQALRAPAEAAIARVTRGASLWEADTGDLIRRGRTPDAELIVDARAAEVELSRIFKLRDQLLGLSGSAVHKPWRRNFEAAGQWVAYDSRGVSRLLPGHPASGSGLLQSVASGGLLTYAATREEAEANEVAVAAALAAPETEPRRQTGGVTVVR